ncbi:MAG: BTAD domain-containing putative transcriptional regulator, partial [Chloroflexota bacterium]
MTLKLSLLGAFQATIAETSWQTFPSQKAQALFVYLTMEHEKRHSRLALSRLFWPEADDGDARNSLRVSLHRLRKTLDSYAPQLSQHIFYGNRQTIYATIDPDYIQVDALTFEANLKAIAKHPHPSLADCPTCLAQLDQTLKLYRGDFLAGQLVGMNHAFDEWILTQRERLHEQAVHGFTQLLDIMARQHKIKEVVALAQRQLVLEPWHEAAHRHLMRSFAYAGRRAEALAQYELCQEILRTEFDIEPAAETQQLYRQILHEREATHAPSNEAGSVRETAVSPTLLPKKPTFAYTPHNLPEPLTSFVGRQAEQQQLCGLFAQSECRLVTLIGEGGIGKTTLALAAARDMLPNFPDGVWLVSLEGLLAGDEVETQEELLLSIGDVLGLDLSSERPLSPQITRHLQNKKSLLILDNFEALAAGAVVLNRLLQQLPHLHCLCTSREPLRLRAEWLLPLPGLTVPPYGSRHHNRAEKMVTYASCQLFAARARQTEPSFTLNDQNADHVATICRLLGGSPLGIELAASWVRQRTLPSIIGAMRHSIDFLCSQRRDLPARQRSLRAVFAGSWELLSTDEQEVVAALSVFRGSFSPSAAQGVAEATPLTLKILHEKSILHLEAERYHLSALWRQYATEQLERLGNKHAMEAKHGRYWLAWLTDLSPSFKVTNDQTAVPHLHTILNDLEQAWHWAQAEGELTPLTAVLPTIVCLYMLAGQQETINGRLRQAITKWQHHPSLAARKFVAGLRQVREEQARKATAKTA